MLLVLFKLVDLNTVDPETWTREELRRWLSAVRSDFSSTRMIDFWRTNTVQVMLQSKQSFNMGYSGMQASSG